MSRTKGAKDKKPRKQGRWGKTTETVPVVVAHDQKQTVNDVPETQSGVTPQA